MSARPCGYEPCQTFTASKSGRCRDHPVGYVPQRETGLADWRRMDAEDAARDAANPDPPVLPECVTKRRTVNPEARNLLLPDDLWQKFLEDDYARELVRRAAVR